eukprot:TRINITY_DN64845_c0_g1_i1.p1 TRINITY_DN64845_c0_g1~~TRINITY_DN64845_c0_g1_i1.p1  ORF type:complete len:903 (-),score=145.17 TRINITY_DN64845_c0_g1_i1:313-2766(-)
MGSAAIKTVELDDMLGGAPVQHRECQGYESPLFLSYFKDVGIEYLPGGVDTGFHHVERDSYETRLMHVKGRRTVRVTEVECKAGSLNTGDVFILDLGLKLFQWNGPTANMAEKAKALEVIVNIKDNQRGGKASITLMDEDPDNADFWGALGGQVEITNPGADDAIADDEAMSDLKLFDMEKLGESLPIESDGLLRRSQLRDDHIFLVDAGSAVYIWVGQKSNMDKRKEAMSSALTYLSKSGRQKTTPLQRVSQGTETQMFKALFDAWEPPRKYTFERMPSQGVARMDRSASAEDVDMDSLTSRRLCQERALDDGSGTLKIWHVVGEKGKWDKVEIPKEQHGQFFGGDCYVLLYSYKQGSRDAHIIYYWHGKSSSIDEKSASAIFASQLDAEMGGTPVQVHVEQGKEPPHFCQLFKGSLIIHAGGKASGFRNKDDQDTADVDGTALFHVKGTNELNTRAVQVPEVAASLNSGDCFVLITPKHAFCWKGVDANEQEVTVASYSAKLLGKDYLGQGGRELLTISEGEEPAEFWAAIGGKADYAKVPPGEHVAQEPRLFHCSNMTGRLRVDEIVDFSQPDLNDGDIFLMDVETTIYVWIGGGANDEEKKFSSDLAERFMKQHSRVDGKKVPVVTIKAGNEPMLFTQHFVDWDPEYTDKQVYKDPYEAKKAALLKKAFEDEKANAAASDMRSRLRSTSDAVTPKASIESKPSEFESQRSLLKKTGTLDNVEENKSTAEGPAVTPVASTVEKKDSQPSQELPPSGFFPLEVLQNGCPLGVIPSRKEDHLSDEDFQRALGTTRKEFAEMKPWKQKQLKEKAKIW